MKFAHIDNNNNNKILGWYDSTINNIIPTPNIEVTEEQWLIAINENHNSIDVDGITSKVDFRTKSEIDLDKINEAEIYLKSTDWITAKYHDVVTINGSMSKTDFIAKYQDIYTARSEARALINSLQVV